MLIGVPKEIKNHEYRVGLTPSSVRELVGTGTRSWSSRRPAVVSALRTPTTRRRAPRSPPMPARVRACRDDRQGQGAAGRRARDAARRPGAVHLPAPGARSDQCRELVAGGAVCIAYETVTAQGGGLPLLAPMSEVAGRLAVQAGAYCLERAHGGMGVLLGGVAGVPPARIVILGAGVVGSNAAQIAVGTGAQVIVIDRSVDALRASTACSARA